MRRVVITGMGAVTPIGNTTEEFWSNVRRGTLGIGEITRFDTSDYKVKIAAEVKNLDVGARMDARAARRMSAFSQYAVVAAGEALSQAKLSMEKEDPYRVGVYIGSGVGGLWELEQEHERLLAKGPSRVKPLLIPMMITNMAAGNVAIAYGLKGKCLDITTACATGTHCIGEAFHAIKYGEMDVCVAGGAESTITPIGVSGFTNLTALSTQPDPAKASIPFDKNRSGFVIGEGAGVLVLEELSHAKARGAEIFAEITGYGATCDAFHITSPAEDGSGAAKAMEIAMQEAGVRPEEVDYINAHGTSTHLNDLFETRAIHLAFGEAAKTVSINSTKSMIGHLLGAAGGVEAIVCVKSIQEGFIHQTIGSKDADEECDLDYTFGAPKEKTVRTVLSNSLGFGGHNGTILFQAYEESR